MKFYLFFLLFGAFSYGQGKDTIAIQNDLFEAKKLRKTSKEASLNILKITLKDSRAINYKKGEIISLIEIGRINVIEYYNFKKGDSILSKAILLSKALNYKKGEAECNFILGVSHSYRGNFLGATKKYIKSLLDFEILKDTAKIIKIKRNIGFTYYELENDVKGEAYLKKAFDLANKANNTLMKVEVTNGTVFFRLKNNKTQGIYKLLQSSEEWAAQLDSKILSERFTIGRIYKLYASYYRLINQSKKSLEYGGKAYRLFKDNVYYRVEIIEELVKTYKVLKRNKKSIEYCYEGIAISKESGLLGKELALSQILLNLQKGKLFAVKERLKLAERVILLKDSIYNERTISKITQIIKNHETLNKERQIADQKLIIKEKEVALYQSGLNQQLVIILCALILIVAIGFYIKINQKQTFLRLRSVMEGEENERQKIARDLHDSINGDLTAFKFKMMNFFDSNNLENHQDSKKIIDDIDLTIERVRDISHNLAPPIFIYKNLVQVIGSFCTNFNLKNKSLCVLFESMGTPVNFQLNYKISLYRIVQELLINIVKHSQATEAYVRMNYLEGKLIINIEDNGIGYDTKIIEKGIGLMNVQTRIKLLDGKLDVVSDKEGTNIFITICFDKLKRKY